MNLSLKCAVAALVTGTIIYGNQRLVAQEKQDSDSVPKKRVPRLPPDKPRVQPSKKPLPKAPGELRQSLPPDSNRLVPRAVPPGEPRVTPGVTDRNELRRQRGGLGAPGIAGRGTLGPSGFPAQGVGRRWVLRPGVNRTEWYRVRSRGLATQLQTEPPVEVRPKDLRFPDVRSRVRAEIAADRVDDWRNWRADYIDVRYPWYRGSWTGTWYDRWSKRWHPSWSRPQVFARLGVTPWGLNRMGYWFGYRDFENPYYLAPVSVGSTRIDYSRPMAALPTSYKKEAALAEFDDARAAFKRRDYSRALRLANLAVAMQPHDSVLHEFRALTLFALADYDAAAEALYPVLAVTPGWDWTTMRRLYASRDEYTRHLRSLESFLRRNRDAAYAHFLLGYHYLTTGYSDAAAAQFRRAVALNSKDDVSRQLVDMLSATATTPSRPVPRVGKQVAIPVERLTGTWTAKRGDEEFTLQLTKEMRFLWKHRVSGRTTEVTGAFAIRNDLLALEPEAGGVLLATISLTAPNRLRFTMLGGESDEPGLTFSK